MNIATTRKTMIVREKQKAAIRETDLVLRGQGLPSYSQCLALIRELGANAALRHPEDIADECRAITSRVPQ